MMYFIRDCLNFIRSGNKETSEPVKPFVGYRIKGVDVDSISSLISTTKQSSFDLELEPKCSDAPADTTTHGRWAYAFNHVSRKEGRAIAYSHTPQILVHLSIEELKALVPDLNRMVKEANKLYLELEASDSHFDAVKDAVAAIKFN